jgi:putative acetyltransferase
MGQTVIAREDPRQPDVSGLVYELDRMFEALYPAESNHLLDIETLARPEVRFFVVRRDGEALGCGALWLHADYGEVKRVYVRPSARGHKLGHLIMRKIEDEARALNLPRVGRNSKTSSPDLIRRSPVRGCRCAGQARA